MNEPVLSIVIPTFGRFSEGWLSELLKVRGAVQFVFVYPPNTLIELVDDPRIKVIVSPYQGEMMQTCIGLLNTLGEYVLWVSDRSLVHKNIIELTEQYFYRFPDSLMVRLKREKIDIYDSYYFEQEWDVIPDIHTLDICRRTRENPHVFQKGNYPGLLEIYMAPLTQRFDLRYTLCFLMKRLYRSQYYLENFSYTIWKDKVVRETIIDLLEVTRVMEAVTWIPLSGFDRLLGLFVQAKFFQKDVIIGHWMPKPAQIRQLGNSSLSLLRRPRLHVLSDILLLIKYPQYGYFWNLFFNQLHEVPKTVSKALKEKLLGKHRQFK